MPGKAATAERVRDLKSQIAGLSAEEVGEILFLEISPGREPVIVYSAEDGSPTPVPTYRIDEVMGLTDKDGNHRFVAEAKDAPEYKPGNVKCFMHKDSPERAILEEIGLSAATCPADQLGSLHSKRQHGLHRHKQEWAAYQEYKENEKEEKREARQDKQLEATLAIARGGVGQAELVQCSECDYKGTKRQLAGHKMGAHK
jgi:hypothetical protein